MVRFVPAPSVFHSSDSIPGLLRAERNRKACSKAFREEGFWNNEGLQSFGGIAGGWFRVVGLFILGLLVVGFRVVVFHFAVARR